MTAALLRLLGAIWPTPAARREKRAEADRRWNEVWNGRQL